MQKKNKILQGQQMAQQCDPLKRERQRSAITLLFVLRSAALSPRPLDRHPAVVNAVMTAEIVLDKLRSHKYFTVFHALSNH